MRRPVYPLLILLVLSALLSGCAARSISSWQSSELFAMDTYMTLGCYGAEGDAKEALRKAEEEIRRLDVLLSAENGKSEISRINRAGEGALSDDTAAIIREALSVSSSTGGLFDITVYPLMRAWGFPERKIQVPEEEDLRENLSRVGYERLMLSKEGPADADGGQQTPPIVKVSDSPATFLTLGEGQKIDLGGIAKGYTSSRVMEVMRESGISAGLISLGGNVQCMGKKPDGSLWRIGIRNPFREELYAGLSAQADAKKGIGTRTADVPEYMGILTLTDRAVVTSGAYERYSVDAETGRICHHILDPRTGMPADSDLLSVTVVSENGTRADALSTALYIMGADAASDYWRDHADEFDMILMTREGTVLVTDGIADTFITDYIVRVIERLSSVSSS